MARRQKKNASSRWRLPAFRPSMAWIPAVNWRFVRRAGLAMIWIIGIGSVITAWTLGLPRLEAHASLRTSVDVQQVSVQFTAQPPWVQGHLEEQLRRTATLQLGGDPMQRDDLLATREALLDTGWFESIDQVRRVRPDNVIIHARFATPYALIRDASGYHLVDATGRLLPKSYGLHEPLPTIVGDGGTLPMLSLVGVHFKRPAVGATWDGADVQAGLKLLRLVQSQPWRDQITEIDVSAFVRDGPIRLRTDRGSVIVWGGPPGEEAALELLAHGKLDRLNLLFRNHGRIDANRYMELDLTGSVTVAR